MYSEKGDLTQGSIFGKLIHMAIPIMGSQLLQMSYSLINMIWLGRIGSGALAASGTGGMYVWLSVGMMMLGSMGAGIGVSQNFGKGDLAEALRYAQHAVWVSILAGIAYGLFLVLGHGPLIDFFNITDKAVALDAKAYLTILGVGIPFTYVNASITSIFNGVGNSRASFLMSSVGLILNVILDPVMIFLVGWGVIGAAVATVISQAAATLVALIFIFKKRDRPFSQFSLIWKPSLIHLKQIITWSVPVALECTFMPLLAMVTSRFEASYGPDAMAAGRIGSQVESITWLVGGGFMQAVTSFVGQNYGARKWARIHKGFRVQLLTMTVYGFCVGSLMLLFGRYIFMFFIPENNIVIEYGAVYLTVMAFCQPPACVEGVAGGNFKGMGRTLPPSVTSLSFNLLRVILAYVFMTSGLGLYGVWIGVCTASSLRGLALLQWHLVARRKFPTADVEVIATF